MFVLSNVGWFWRLFVKGPSLGRISYYYCLVLKPEHVLSLYFFYWLEMALSISRQLAVDSFRAIRAHPILNPIKIMMSASEVDGHYME